MLSNVMSTARLPSPVSVFGTLNATRGFIDFMRSSKLSTSIAQELALVDRRQRLLRIAGQVGHDAHDERHLHLFLRAVQLDVVFDLHARRAIAADEFLTALLGHGTPPPRSSMSVGDALAVVVTRLRMPPMCLRLIEPVGRDVGKHLQEILCQ